MYPLLPSNPPRSKGHQQHSSKTPCPEHLFLFFLSLLASDLTSRSQVFLGRPLFLCPWGIHLKALYAMFESGLQRMCPIQRHLLHIVLPLWGDTSRKPAYTSFLGAEPEFRVSEIINRSLLRSTNSEKINSRDIFVIIHFHLNNLTVWIIIW